MGKKDGTKTYTGGWDEEFREAMFLESLVKHYLQEVISPYGKIAHMAGVSKGFVKRVKKSMSINANADITELNFQAKGKNIKR